MLPPHSRAHVLSTGWGVAGFIPANSEAKTEAVEKGGMVFVYGPRSEREGEFVWGIVRRSWGWATGRVDEMM